MSSLPTTGILYGPSGISTDGILFDTWGVDIVSIAPPTVGDDGGWAVVATGHFPTSQGTLVRIQDTATGLDALCYSGVIGHGEFCDTEDGSSITFIVPPLPIGGLYDVYVESEDGLFTDLLADALTVVHRSFTQELYNLRRSLPAPRHVGPSRISDED